MRKKYKGIRGQRVCVDYGRDDSSLDVGKNEAAEGKSMGGGPNDLSHSVSSGSAKQRS